MADETNINTQEGGTTAVQNAKPESGNNTGAEKTFTQDEVNRIVSERLARERAKNDNSGQTSDPITEREKQLAARESKMACKEYLQSKRYPEQLLEVFNTENETLFKDNVEKLRKAFPYAFEPICNAVRETNGTITGAANDVFSAIFKPKK